MLKCFCFSWNLTFAGYILLIISTGGNRYSLNILLLLLKEILKSTLFQNPIKWQSYILLNAWNSWNLMSRYNYNNNNNNKIIYINYIYIILFIFICIRPKFAMTFYLSLSRNRIRSVVRWLHIDIMKESAQKQKRNIKGVKNNCYCRIYLNLSRNISKHQLEAIYFLL